MDKCNCSMTINALGDGCRYCNPQYYIEILEDQTADDQKENDALAQRVKELEDERDNITEEAASWKTLADKRALAIKTAITLTQGHKPAEAFNLLTYALTTNSKEPADAST